MLSASAAEEAFCEIGCQRLCADRQPMEKYASALQANTCKTDILCMVVGIRRMLFMVRGSNGDERIVEGYV